MGVRCSSSCRCIGCKNVFGHTNGKLSIIYCYILVQNQIHLRLFTLFSEKCAGESDAVTINDVAKHCGDSRYH